jgi:CheY-like chemotaxis protein
MASCTAGPPIFVRKAVEMQSSPNASTCTVLLIEDDPEELALWSSALRSCSTHYSVLEAANSQEGLDLLKHQSVDCVIVDLDLSISSGFHVLLELIPNRYRPEVAVIILTRLRNPTLANISLENGAQAYLVKKQTSAHSLDKEIQRAMTSVALILGKSSKVCG